MSNKKIVLTGGGTGGHVTPNIALIPKLVEAGYDVHYIGSYDGIERELITNVDDKYNVKYYGISSGKLRRQITLKNIADAFKVIKGIGEALSLISGIKPDVIFSKGGYVTVPVVLASKMKKVPIVIHESDLTPGLANKIATPYASVVCTSFESTVNRVKNDNVVCTGSPIRDEIFEGDRGMGLKIFKFKENKPIITLMGGSMGSKNLNETIRRIIVNNMLDDYNIVHLAGKDNIDESIECDNYKQFEYLHDELPHLFACTDLFLTRGGANAIFEIRALCIPNIIVPLSKKVSRGDQIQNAYEFKQNGYSEVIEEEKLTSELLISSINDVLTNKEKYINEMQKVGRKNTLDTLLECIKQYSN